MVIERASEVCVLCTDRFELFDSGTSVMADDVLISAAKSKRESRASILETQHENVTSSIT